MRLSVIISTKLTSHDEGLEIFDVIKMYLTSMHTLKITGNISTILDPCCGKETKNAKND